VPCEGEARLAPTWRDQVMIVYMFWHWPERADGHEEGPADSFERGRRA
jgi:hypothetical protein